MATRGLVTILPFSKWFHHWVCMRGRRLKCLQKASTIRLCHRVGSSTWSRVIQPYTSCNIYSELGILGFSRVYPGNHHRVCCRIGASWMVKNGGGMGLLTRLHNLSVRPGSASHVLRGSRIPGPDIFRVGQSLSDLFLDLPLSWEY